MEGFWSLTFFTIFGQAAAGIVMLKTVFGDKSKEKWPCWLVVSFVLTGIALIMSLFHLSAPFSAYYSITNAGTSWLSREILAVGLFSGLLCVYAFIRTWYISYLLAFAAFTMIYSMARVYMLQTVAVWNNWLVFTSFLAIAFLLGATILLILELKANKDKELEQKTTHSGSLSLIMAFALSVHLVVVAWQFLMFSGNVNLALFIWQYVLLLLGAMVGLTGIIRKSLATENTKCPCCCVCYIGIASLLIWAGAICGRVLFYTSYTYFGM